VRSSPPPPALAAGPDAAGPDAAGALAAGALAPAPAEDVVPVEHAPATSAITAIAIVIRVPKRVWSVTA
jgi:hypothetical protein